MTSGLLGRLRLIGTRSAARETHGDSTRQSARAAVAWFVATTLGLSCATLLAADVLAPAIRDPEYGRRANALHSRLAENPERPLVMVVGSSRVGAAICPAAWEGVRESNRDPLIFNMGRAGAGPVVQLMMLRRVLGEGARPAVVLLEYWPSLLNHETAPQSLRVSPEHIFPRDLSLLRDYWPEIHRFENRVWRGRLNPIYTLRRDLMLQLDPTWMPWASRTEMVWANLDPWGWLPGLDFPPEGCSERQQWIARWEPTLRPQLQTFAVCECADRAMRDAVTLAREHGAAVGFVYLPEPSEIRDWYSRKADRASQTHLAKLARELNVPVIDTRTWLADGYVADGIHLSRIGAEVFTRRLVPAVIATFPEVKP